MQIFAPAKLNICLDILKKDTNGYHEIRTVFVELKQFQDQLEIKNSQNSDNVSMLEGLAKIPSNCAAKMKENLVYKAIKLVKKEFSIQKNVHITITKNIPLSSGLGGASSDAAATLKALDQLWNLQLSKEKFLQLAKNLGSDVAFFINGGVALGTHYGEILEKLPEIKCLKFEALPVDKWPILPENINSKHKTGQLYESLDLSKCGQNQSKTDKLIQGIEQQNADLILENLHNDFEALYLPTAFTSIHHLSGSGPAIFSAQVS